MKRIIHFMVAICIQISGCNLQKEKTQIEQWDVYEIVLDGPSSGN